MDYWKKVGVVFLFVFFFASPSLAIVSDAEELPNEFRIPDFGTPLVVQVDWNCYDHASRGVIEWLVNRARCLGEREEYELIPLNQELPKLCEPKTRDRVWTRWYERRKLADSNLGEAYWPMHYLELEEVKSLFPSGTHIEQDLLFTTHAGKIYEPPHFDADGDEQTSYGVGLKPTQKSRHSPGYGDALWQNGGVHESHVQKVKNWIKRHQSPVFFIFKPLTADYWHAAYILGWNETGFVVRDSSFGKAVKDRFRNMRTSRDLMVMPYPTFEDSAKAAAGYRVRGLTCPIGEPLLADTLEEDAANNEVKPLVSTPTWTRRRGFGRR